MYMGLYYNTMQVIDVTHTNSAIITALQVYHRHLIDVIIFRLNIIIICIYNISRSITS